MTECNKEEDFSDCYKNELLKKSVQKAYIE